MRTPALRLPAALAACLAVVVAGTPGAVAAPDPTAAPGPTAGPGTAGSTVAAPVLRDDEIVLAELEPAGEDGAARLDVLANDTLADPAGSLLLLPDPGVPDEEPGRERATGLGLLRVVGPDTDPADLPAGWEQPEHPVLALGTAGADGPAPERLEVDYVVVDAAGTSARAVLTLVGDPAAPEPTRTAPSAAAEAPATAPATEPAERPGTEGAPEEDDASREDTAPGATAPGAAEEPGTADRPSAAAADEDAGVPAAVRQALEAAAQRAGARTGAPAGPMQEREGGWEWPHERGTVLYAEAHGAHFVQLRGAIGQKWLRSGAVAGLGWPLEDEACGLPGGGCRQGFSRGRTVHWSPATGAHWVQADGAIGYRWARAGGPGGSYGHPVTDERCGLTGGGCYQVFAEGHTVYWRPGTGARAVKTNGAIGHKWVRAGRENGTYGYPVTDETCGLPSGGCRQVFAKGRTVYWSPATGARAVQTNGAIGHKWILSGRERGTFGYPVTDETGTGTVVQTFQRGLITWSRSGGTRTHLFRGECHHLNTGRSVQPTRNAARVSLTIAEGYGRSQATFVNCVRIAGSYVEEWRTSAHVGASGFKRPGVPSGHTQYLYSPQGSYSVTESFGVYDPGTALPYRQLNPNSRWGGRPGTLYNKYFESTGYTWPDENMWYFAQSGDYRLGVVINYNRPPDSPIVQGNGFAIFLHANKVPTAGCISLHEHEVARYMRTARPGDRIIMGVRADLFR
ncbi:hypothetical protein LQU92_05715 [Kocuria sp. LUK]|uniref:L,D-transpeptidase family protein n=1 Tax=Kocuria sp. LUK TaxID=2897828 RepID=UPI001E333B05|nr:L,D-transpeptidase family protein [Kocuria sp. LUK]MCD1144741.1 hypothetical protein [Kocuria sp. LUK]